MTYIRTNWVDRDVEFPRRIRLEREDSTQEVVNYDLEPGSITQQGTPVNAVNLNNIEEGIVDLDEFVDEQIIYLESSGADDTSNFLNALTESQNKILVLDRQGIYTISGTLQPPAGCKIFCRNSIIINNINTQSALFHITNSNVEISDVSVMNTTNNPGNDGITDAWYLGANFFIDAINNSVNNIVLNNINITNSIDASSAITIMGLADNIRVSNCNVWGTGDGWGSCFHAEWMLQAGNVVSPKNIIFENCIARNNFNATPNCSGFWLSACSRAKLINCRVENSLRGFGIYTGDQGKELEHPVNMSLENCQTYDIQNECIQVFSTMTSPDPQMVVNVTNCHFRGADMTESLSAGARLYYNAGVINFENCIFENLRRGIYFGDATAGTVTYTVKNCVFDDIYLQAFYGWRCINSVIEHNKFKKINISGNSTAFDAVIVFIEDSKYNTINANSFGLDDTVQSCVYIYFVADTDTTSPTENTISNNFFIGTNNCGVNFSNNATALHYLVRNYFYNNQNINQQTPTGGAFIYAKLGDKRLVYTSDVPNTGNWRVGDYAVKTNVTVAGSAGDRYIISGWTRITSGSNNVLGTDWMEDRRLTGT